MSFPYLLLTSNTFGGREGLHKDRFEVETLDSEGLCLGRRPSVVNHVHTSLARQAYNLDNLGAYQAAALSARDNLLVRRFSQFPRPRANTRARRR